MMNLSWVMSARNATILYNTLDSTLGFRGVWNKTLRSINHCSNFHMANASEFFFYWPEDNPDFQYCCEFVTPNLMNTTDYLKDYQNLSDYRYSEHGYYIGSGAYYDLGLIDKSFPFWRYKGLYKKYLALPTFSMSCEYQDLIGLFQSRFQNKVILKYGLLETALPAIALLELCVFLIILGELLYMKGHRYKKHFNNEMNKPKRCSVEAWIIFKKWFDGIYKVMLMDWLHICLLSFVGNGLLKAVGRDDAFLWTSRLFYNYTDVYLGLLIVLCISSVLQQVAHWIAVDKTETLGYEKPVADEEKGHADVANKEFQVAQRQRLENWLYCIKEEDDPTKELQKLLEIGPDYKWQPIAAQSAILFCLWGYLTYIVTENTAGTVLGFVVQAASPWSGIYALRVTFITVPFIISTENDAKKMHEVYKKVKEKFWSSKVGKYIKPTKKDVDAETRKPGLKPEQGPLPPKKDVVDETATPSLKPEQGPLPPQNDVVVEAERLGLEAQHGPLPPKNDAVIETEKSNLKPDGGP